MPFHVAAPALIYFLGSACIANVKSRVFALVGLFFTLSAFGQGRVNWGNTSTTLIYTNDCNGNIGPISGYVYRFGLYLGPFGSPASSLSLVGSATNSSAIPGRMFASSTTSTLPAGFPSGMPIAFQVRGWSSSGGASYEAALAAVGSGVPGVYVGTSDLGYFTPTADPQPAPSIFGTGPGQVGGFELRGPFCRELATRRIAPDGPVTITRVAGNQEVVWTNIFVSNAIYHVRAASAVTGPYTNYTTLTANTFQVTYTNPYQGSSVFLNVEWADAPLPQPIGTWNYQAFDSSGAVMAVGIFTFTSNVPATVSRNFSRIQTGAQNSVVLLHPAGPGTLDAYSISRSNLIELAYAGGEFRIRGQMVFDYYAGDWFATDYLSFIPEDPPPPGSPIAIVHTGRFVAKRRF